MIRGINVPLHDAAKQSQLVRRRLFFMVGVVMFLVSCLIARLVWLQLFQHSHYTSLSHDNRVSLIVIPPARGLIYDRNGVLLAHNVLTHNVELYPQYAGDLEKTLDQLAQLILLSTEDLTEFKEARQRAAPGNRVLLRTALSDAEVARLAINRHRLPGVEIVSRLQRHYPLGELTSHVIGYVGRISTDDLASINKKNYKGIEYIGKLGLEAVYEERLLGRAGYEQVETSAHGSVVRTLRRQVPQAGIDVQLGFDVALQRVAMQALGGRRGAVVAIEPATGDVLAFASTPSYNPNIFVGDVDNATYQAVSGSPHKPLLNRALHGRYSPGSTIKNAIAMAGLRHGFTKNKRVYCSGAYSLPNSSHRYRCWNKAGHGSVSLFEAIVQSCDVYFYNLARYLGIKRLSAFLGELGLGRTTNIDLRGEPSGLLPSPAWKRRVHNEPWHRGETLIAGIGQGAMLMTPLQLANMTATIANRGLFMQPRFVIGLGTPGDENYQVPAPVAQPVKNANRAHYETVIKAMENVVHGPLGTARGISGGVKYRIAGKTGTTQVIRAAQNEPIPKQEDLPQELRDHALFIAFAPVKNPRIAVAVIVENGGSGGRTAAPVARRVLDQYLLTEPVTDLVLVN